MWCVYFTQLISICFYNKTEFCENDGFMISQSHIELLVNLLMYTVCSVSVKTARHCSTRNVDHLLVVQSVRDLRRENIYLMTVV